MSTINTLGQPVGDPLPQGWAPPPVPTKTALTGRLTHVVPLDVEAHGQVLYQALQKDETGAGWTYMSNGPYDDIEPFVDWLHKAQNSLDPLFFAFLNAQSSQAIGYGALMRIDAAMASVEVGNIRMSPLLQRTPMSTEAIHLMAEHVFALGYRRFEWKCDSLNAPSRRAAERLGFTFEGIFRNAMHYKGRSRDTAWFSIIDDEWPMIREAQQAWLHPDNFTEEGVQKTRLQDYLRTAHS